MDPAALLADAFGVAGTLTRVGGENENALVDAGDARYVLKLVADADADVFALEDAALEALRDAEPELGLPHAVPARDGERVTRAPDGRAARLLTFVDGTPWVDAGEPSAERCRDLGALLARIAMILGAVEHPAAARTHRWDLARAAQHRRLVPLVDHPARRRALDDAFALFAAHAPLLDDVPRGLIHGDVNDENVLVDGDEVVGLLDLGDCLDNPLVCDLAIALAYVMQRSDEPLGAAAEVVAGYHALRPLTDDEFTLLFPCVLGRLAVTVATCAERRRVDTGRASWFVSEEASWELLLALVAIDPADMEAALGARADRLRPPHGAEPASLRERRARALNPALSLAYDEPLKVVRGRGAHLFDHRGRAFLDLVNNVCHVGHCHPRVVRAGQEQMARLNTNTRYLHDGLVDYAERLRATLPDELDTVFLVNSGSEANELALRLAWTHTGRRDVLVVDGAYHGHTSALIDVSPYKFMGRGGRGAPADWVHVVPVADGYRGAHRGQGVETGRAYGDEVGRVIAEAGRPIAAFLSESLLGCGGQVVPPDGYFERAFEHVRAAGGVCILDEVQVGFGRVGDGFWAFERQGVVPDVVVMGKPIGDGHPMAAVVARRAIAESFDNGMEFFATFGGNPVSCAIGLAVLDVIADEGLQEHARVVGARLLDGLRDLAARHALIGDVRGVGLFVGVELVTDRDTLAPARDEAEALVNAMRRRGVLLSTDGPLGNVIKIKPPMVVDADDVDRVLRLLDDELGALAG